MPHTPTPKSMGSAPSSDSDSVPPLGQRAEGAGHLRLTTMVQLPMIMLMERDARALEDLVAVAFGSDHTDGQAEWARSWIDTASAADGATATRMRLFEELLYGVNPISSPDLSPWVAVAFMKRWGYWPQGEREEPKALDCVRCKGPILPGATIRVITPEPLEVFHVRECPSK